MKLGRLPALIMLILIGGIYILESVLQQTAFSQPTCPPVAAMHPSNPPSRAWPASGQINVNIDPALSTDQRNATVAAITAWNASNGCGLNNNESRVFFPPPTYNSTKLTSSFTDLNLQITKDTTISTPANISWGSAFGGTRTYGEMKLNTNMIFTFPNWFQYIVAHEIGHSFGMENCELCAPCLSVMSVGSACNQGCNKVA